MEPAEIYEASVKTVRTTKEATYAQGDPMLNTFVEGWHQGELCVVVNFRPDRDLMLTTASMAALGLDCDFVFMAYETYHSTLELNPLSGERWEPGEMQYVYENYPQCQEEGWVLDAVSITAFDMEGTTYSKSMTFTQADGEVTWVEDQDFAIEPNQEEEEVPALLVKGLISEAIEEIRASRARSVKATQVLTNTLRESFPELDPVKLKALTDLYVLGKFVESVGPGNVTIALAATPDSPRASVIDKYAKFAEGNELDLSAAVISELMKD
jgi:hypothetical protein